MRHCNARPWSIKVLIMFLTHTTVSVSALMGAIMGVATANSILVVSFAKEELEASTTRFRLVLMTALAMIIGMATVALGLGDGGKQHAPLGATTRGLTFATVATLFFVPTVFGLLLNLGRNRKTEDVTVQCEIVEH